MVFVTWRTSLPYLWACILVGCATALLVALRGHINIPTAGFALLLCVVVTATRWSSGPAVLASVLAMLVYNYFFLPPVGAFTIADPQNWVALTAFSITAVIVGQLSARARRRAEEAERARAEIERLYRELQSAFEKASQAEALRRSEQLKSALLDAVTHDLRTPLTSIKASISTLMSGEGETSEDPVQLTATEKSELLTVIDEESDRLNKLIEGLVGLARLEAGEISLRPNWGTLDDMIADALARGRSELKRHRVEVRLPDDLPLIRVDSRAVAEVVFSLLENAAKYSPAGTLITITGERSREDEVMVTVADEGPGVPPELRERVFSRFFRAQTEDSAWGKGLGMGLAIARGIVEAHGGRIWVEPGANRGSQFRFTVPIGDNDEPSAS
jgi:two-component system sensor histidine kinase KdpD